MPADFNAALPRGTVTVTNLGGLVEIESDLPDTHQIRLLKEALAWLETPTGIDPAPTPCAPPNEGEK